MSEPRDLEHLAAYAAGLDARRLPAEVVTCAKACLLYGLAVGVGTRRARPAKLALCAADRQRESGATTRLIDGVATSQGSATFANAVLLSGRVQGDSHPCGHIGGVVIPAALGAAEESNASGVELLSALVAGYEVALRIGRDHAADLSVNGFRTTPCYGVFGASAAIGRLRAFGPQQLRSALGLAANFAGGLREYVDAGTEESPFQAGFAARNGVYVADLVACGLESAPSALHGAAGFYRAFGAGEADYGRRLTENLGTDFELQSVTWKQYPACQFLRGIIRGLGRLREASHGAGVRSIEIRMNPFEADFIGVRYAGPFTSATQTVMSAPFCAALAWVSGTASFDGLREFADPAVNSLLHTIRIVADPDRKRYEPYIEVDLTDGRKLQWAEEAGDSNYRLTWQAACDMTLQLCAEVDVPGAKAQRLIDTVARIEAMPDVKALVAAVCAATTH
jgi:2-methylcitrate dehydratase PrpD